MSNGGKTLLDGQYSIPEFEFLANNYWMFTEKVDGTNIRIMWNDGHVQFGGKTDNASLPAPLVDRLRKQFPDDSMFVSAFPGCSGNVCLYGEGYGPKIQNGGKYKDYQDFVLFDVKVGDWWLQRNDVIDVADKLGLDVVPVIGYGTLAECIEMVQGGFKSHWGDFEAEGVVARPSVELFNRGGQRIITKIKCRDFR
ncbi:RNA ligase family protein [Rosistilla oblonga]|uniref:RNA ligase family protein n=1 Tax=Rosistilla oblonga TaxID=2527990 RepID=UPI003A973D3E